MQTGVDGLTSRTIIERSSVKAELKVCCSLSPLPPPLIFVCFHSPSPVFILCCAFYDSHCLCFLHNAPFTLILSVLVVSILHHHHHHPTSSLSPPSLNLVELLSPPSLPSLLQSTCDTLRSHSDSLGFTPNVLPRHPTLGNFEEFAC